MYACALAQVESLAQLGVQLLLFRLGLELSLSKLRAVWGTAVGGGTLQVLAAVAIGSAGALLAGAPVGQVRATADAVHASCIALQHAVQYHACLAWQDVGP